MKITQTKDIRTVNRWELFEQVLHNYPISRAQLCALTGLNKATVSTIVKEWIDLGLLTETELGSASSGRKPILMVPQMQAGHILSVDINVHSVRIVLTDLSGEYILLRNSFKIEDKHFAAVYKQLHQSIDNILKQEPASSYGLIGIGVSVHGIVDLSGLIRFVPQLGWRNIDLRTLLQEQYQVPVFVDNAGNFAAIAEQNIEMDAHGDNNRMTLRLPYQSLAVINISDSISAGLIINGEIFRGYHGFANAVGHHTINYNETKQCHCGKYGCWEQYCTDSAVIANANRVLDKPVDSIEEFVNRIQHEDTAAKEVLEQFIHYLAIGLTNIEFIFDCEAIAVSSKLLSSLPYYLPKLLKSVVLPITHTEKIYLSRLGENGAILGAANTVKVHFFQEMAHTDSSK